MKALSGGRSPRLSPPAGRGQAAFASTELHTFEAHRLAYGCAGQVIVPHDTMPANDGANGFAGQFHAGERRSEEQPSELQSLMRISYAVFCLKKQMQTKYSKH